MDLTSLLFIIIPIFITNTFLILNTVILDFEKFLILLIKSNAEGHIRFNDVMDL